MEKRRTVVLAFLGAALLLLALFGAFDDRDAKLGRGPPDNTTSSEPELEAHGTSPKPPAGRSAQPRADPAPDEPLHPARRFVVRGRVDRPDGSPAGGSSIRAKPSLLSYEESGLAPEALTAVDGTYELDVSALFHIDGEMLMTLAVEATHPRLLAVSALIAVSGRDRMGPGRAYDLDLQLGRAAVLTGQLVREDGSPVANGWARILRLASGAVRQPEGWQVSASADANGRFRIVHPEDDVEFVLFGNAPDLAPACRVVRIHLDRATEVEPLVLPRGAAVTGWLRVRGEGVPGMAIVAKRNWRDKSESVLVGQDPGAVLWKDGAVSAQARATTTDETGRFELTGLAKGEHHVRLGVAGSVGVHWDLVRGHVRPTVVAPVQDVVIDFDGVWLTLRFVNEEGEAQPRTPVSLGGYGMSAGGDGTLRILLPPHARMKARVWGRNGYAGRELTIETAATGMDQEQTVTLVPPLPTPSVEIVFEGHGAEHVDLVGLSVCKPGAKRSVKGTKTLTREEGIFTWHDAMPGTWDLELRPGGTWHVSGLFLPVAKRVEIPERGVQRLAMKIEAGGGLELEVRGPDGRPIRAKCELTDPGGRPVDAIYWGRSKYGGSGGRGRLSHHGVTRVAPALASGTYHVHLTYRGFQDLELTADVVAGETTTLRAIMLRAK